MSVVQQIDHTYTFHAIPTPELKADELMRKMWDNELVGLAHHKSGPLTAEEMLAAEKASRSRRYLDVRYEVGIPWVDDQPPLYSNRAGPTPFVRKAFQKKARGCRVVLPSDGGECSEGLC